MKWLDSMRYRRQVDEWVERVALVDDRLTEARKAFEGVFTLRGLQLEAGERLIEVQPVNLMETRRVRVTNYGSVSHHTKNHSTFRTGQARSESHDELREVDHGRLVITDRRIIYLGSKSREIRWRKLIQHTVGPGAAEFHAVGLKTPLQVTYSRASGAKLRFMLRVALAALDGSESEFVEDLSAELVGLRRNAPSTPDGVEVDPRVGQLALGAGSAPRALPPASAVAAGDDRPNLPRGQFNVTPLDVVTSATSGLGFATTVIAPGTNGQPGPTVITLPTPTGTTSLGIEVTVFACLPDQLVELATQAKAEWSIVATPVAVDGITVLDGPSEPPVITHIDEEALDSLCRARVDSGSAVQQLRGLANADEAVLLRLRTQLRIARALTKKQQVLVLDASVDSGDLATEFAGADEVVLVGQEVVEEHQETPTETSAVEMSPVAAVTVAGTRVEHPEQIVKEYLAEYPDTIRRYDGTAGRFPTVTADLVAATRVLRSRITHDEAAWFIERAATAPWDTVDEDAQLADADPCVVGGLYDRASTLYGHFRAEAPKGIKAAKIYKVLHLMRPGLFPILDSRLAALYDSPARAIAPVVNKCRPDLPASKQAFWAAIRIDLINAASELAAIRGSLNGSGDAYLANAIDTLSDLRILDILGWKGGDPADD